MSTACLFYTQQQGLGFIIILVALQVTYCIIPVYSEYHDNAQHHYGCHVFGVRIGLCSNQDYIGKALSGCSCCLLVLTMSCLTRLLFQQITQWPDAGQHHVKSSVVV